jgi:hypothetical protein
MKRPGFMGLLCPMVKQLNLSSLTITIDPPHFVAICELTILEVLSISGEWGKREEVKHAPTSPDYISIYCA